MSFKKIILTISVMYLSFTSIAQIGGEGAYDFLNLTSTPRVAALGGKLAALDESDIGTILHNPALLNPEMHNQIAFSYVGYYADIKYGSFLYSRDAGLLGSFAVGSTYVNYGSFIEADPTGQITGKFYANDFAVNLFWSKTFDTLFSIGINLKPVFSHLERYKSWGIAADIGAVYNSPNRLFTAGVALRNIGSMIKPYTPDTWQELPFEILAGFSKKLGHAPFRFVVTFHQLQNYDIYYQRDNSNTTLGTDDSQTENKVSLLGKEALSHLIIGFEFQPVKSFYFRAGYNYQRRNELKILEKVSTVGFSWGFGIRISKFHFSYSRATYHLAGSTNHFSITTDIDEIFGWNKL